MNTEDRVRHLDKAMRAELDRILAKPEPHMPSHVEMAQDIHRWNEYCCDADHWRRERDAAEDGVIVLRLADWLGPLDAAERRAWLRAVEAGEREGRWRRLREHGRTWGVALIERASDGR